MKNMKSTMVRMTAVMLCVVCGLVSPSFGDQTWTGAGANSDWSNTNNWVGGTAIPGQGETAIFDSSTVNGNVYANYYYIYGNFMLTNGLTQDVIFRYINIAYGNALIKGDTGITIMAGSRDLVLSLYGGFMRNWGVSHPWFVGSGRTLTANCRISNETGITKKGQGTVIFAREIFDNQWDLTVNEGLVKTVIDNAGTMGKWNVAAGTWEFGAQNQTISGLWGNGAVKSPTGDTVFMGPVTRVNGDLISTNRNYVYKLDFGNGGGATVNGVVFTLAGRSGAGWVLDGAGGEIGEAGGSSGFNQFISDFYHGGPSSLAFTNLTVGTKYEAVIYSAPSWGSRIQDATFSNGTDVVVLRDTEPGFTGYYVYRFTANTKLASITMSAWTAGKYHWYGATLEDLTGVVPGSRAATLAVGSANNGDFGGVISGDIALVKQGSGTQVLSGPNTYSGATIISNGTLRLQNLVTPVAVTAQSSYTPDGRTAIHAIDGAGMSPSSIVGYDSTAGNGPANAMWLSNNTKATWLTFDLGSVQTLAGLRLWNYNENGNMEINRGVRTAGIYTGTNLLAEGSVYGSAGAAWGTLVENMTFAKGDRTATLAGSDYVFAAPVTTRYLQLYVTDNFPGADAYTGISEIRFLPAASPTNILPATTALTIASGGVLDISRVSQDVATLSGSGVVSNGTLGVTSALYPGGAGVTNTLTLQGLTLSSGASLYWDYGTGGADLVRVLGTATLPANATVRVNATDVLPVRVTLFQCGTVNAPSGVSGWTVVGGRANSRVVIQGNEVQLYSPRGTIISFY